MSGIIGLRESRGSGLINGGQVSALDTTGTPQFTAVKTAGIQSGTGTASFEITAGTGDLGFANTDVKIKLPSAGGIYESDGSTAVLTESGGEVTLDNVALGSSVTGGIPAGMIAPFAMASAPTGWLICNASRVSTTTYAALVTAIYVGDGSNASTSIEWGQKWDAATGGSRSTSGTYLSLPDLRGAFLRGTGSHGTSTMAAGAAFAGPSVGAYQNDGIQLHGHSIRLHTTGAVNGVSLGYLSSPTVKTGQVTDLNTSSAGTPRGEQETRPFNAGVNYCIKY